MAQVEPAFPSEAVRAKAPAVLPAPRTCQNLRIFAQNEGFAQNIQIFEKISKNGVLGPLGIHYPD